VLMFDGVERDMMFLTDIYKAARKEGASWLDEPDMRREFITLMGEMQALRQQIRGLLREPHGTGLFSMTPSLVKMARAALGNKIGDFRTRAEGIGSQFVDHSNWRSSMYEFLDTFGATIAGGSNEIQRNLIAERGLGMPRG